MNYPIYHPFNVCGERFIAVRKTDEKNSAFHIVSELGRNYGAWSDVDTFREAFKITKEFPDHDGLRAEPLGDARLSVRVV